MIAALIVANIVQAIAFAFSRTANKAIITEVVEKDEIVTYNAHLELTLQVVGVSSPVFSFLVLQFASLHATLLLDALTFFIAFVLVAFLPKEVAKVQEKKQFTPLFQSPLRGQRSLCDHLNLGCYRLYHRSLDRQ